MKKICIIGSGGAGKSTLARKLGEILGIEVIHLDSLFWKPDWTPTPRQEWMELQKELVKKDNWIIDGNYSSTMEIRLDAADTVIYLHFSRLKCVWRAIKRWIRNYNKVRPDMGEGCVEKLDFDFLKWIWNFPKYETPRIIQKLSRVYGEKRVIILKSDSHVNMFLENVKDMKETEGL